LIGQVGGLFIQAAEGSRTIPSVRSPKGEMRVERPGFTVEAATHESPFDILLQATESGARFDANPDYLRAADRREGSKTLYGKIELTRGRGHMEESLLDPLHAVFRDLAEKLQRHVVVLRVHPTHGKLTFPEDL
jgi:hypothetical protein